MGKNVDNLDDVANLLSKKSEQKIILKKRNQSQRILRNKRKKREVNEDRKIMVIPILILLLILLIKFLEFLGMGGSSPLNLKIPVSTSELGSPSNIPEEATEPVLKEYNDDVLEKFFQEYFQAKLSADVDTLYRLSGVTNQSTEQRNKLQSQLKTQSGYIESYEDIKTYAVPGIGENEKLVFLQYKVRFRRAKTPAPAIMYCYMRVNEANAFELVENNDFSYDFKFADRTEFEKMKKKARAQEIIIVKNGQITDTSFSNLLFLKNQTWYTPKSFLLNGVQQQNLLKQGIIKETEITLENLNEFSHFQLINSMNEFNQDFVYSIEELK